MAKTQINLGIETSDTGFRLALFDVKARKVLQTGIVTLPENPLQSVGAFEEAVQLWLQQAGSPALTAVHLALPAVHGVIRDIRIPPDVDDCNDYIRWELEATLSSPLDQYYHDVDFYPSVKKPQGALVAAFRRAQIDSLCTGFTNRKLVPSLVEPDVFSLLNLLEIAEGIDQGLNCVIKADRAGILVFWGNGHLLGPVRWCATDALGVEPDPVVYSRLAESLYRLLVDGFGSVASQKPQVRLCGDLAVEAAFTDALSLKLQDFELLLWDSFLRLSLAADGNTSRSVPVCVGAIGAAVRQGGRK